MKFQIIPEHAHDLKQSMMDVGVGKRTVIPILERIWFQNRPVGTLQW
jgi:hypothetical protein